MQTYEVEIKTLLGSSEKAEALRKKMKELDTGAKLVSRNRQLNHYFEPAPDTELRSEALKKLVRVTSKYLSDEAGVKLDDLATKAKEFSVRTRDKDGTVFLVVKASVGSDTSANGVARMEFEEKVDVSLGVMDSLVLSAGFAYQAKWSREREEYTFKNLNVCLDRNAGYGWLAEFEKIINQEEDAGPVRQEIITCMRELGVEELPQDRLERMFAYYNKHWQEYYGMDKVFTVI